MYLHDEITRIMEFDDFGRVDLHGVALADVSVVTRETVLGEDVGSWLPERLLKRASPPPPHPKSVKVIGEKAFNKARAAGKSRKEAQKIAQKVIDDMLDELLDRPQRHQLDDLQGLSPEVTRDLGSRLPGQSVDRLWGTTVGVKGKRGSTPLLITGKKHEVLAKIEELRAKGELSPPMPGDPKLKNYSKK